MGDTNSAKWNSSKPDSVCADCYYCQQYDLLGGMEYWCTIYNEKPYWSKTDDCLNNDHKFFEERSKYMTVIPKKREVLESTCMQIAKILDILDDYCHNTGCANCIFTDTGNGFSCYFKKDSGLNPTEFYKLTEQIRGD